MHQLVSFRGRLTLFFLLIVVLPMVAVAVLVTQVTSQSRNGKADARLAAGLETALSTYRDDVAAAKRAANQLGRDPTLGAALQSAHPTQVQAAARAAARQAGVRSLAIRDPSGHPLAAVGRPQLVAPYRLILRGPGGDLGELTVSTKTPFGYLAEVRHLTGRDAALLGPIGPTAQTLDVGGASLSARGDSGRDG